jgi:hypothetical protein
VYPVFNKVLEELVHYYSHSFLELYSLLCPFCFRKQFIVPSDKNNLSPQLKIKVHAHVHYTLKTSTVHFYLKTE